MGLLSPSFTITLFLFLKLALLSSVSAFNITYALDNHSEFYTFNKLLTRTHLNKYINKKTTVTVMAVRNSPAMDFLASQSEQVMRQVLATHVLLDYVDASKLAGMEEKDPQELTTFWQQSGKAEKRNGLILAVRVKSKAFFRSAVKGAKQRISYVREVATQPYNISLIEVSQPLFAPGLNTAGSPIPSGSPGPVSPLPIPPAEAPEPEDDTADAPEPEGDEAPESAPAPAPGSSPSPSPDADQEKEDDDPKPELEPEGKSAGNKIVIGVSTTAATVAAAAAALMAF